jgi:GTP-binding protein Era
LISAPSAPFRTGDIAIVGRPNVGKSTLLNRLVGQKLSITSRKPQTTRQRIAGIVTRDDAQLVFLDLPGFQTRHGSALNRGMNQVIARTLRDADVIVMVVEALHFAAEDRVLLGRIDKKAPTVLAINKIDRLSERKLLLPFIERMARERPFQEIVPISAEQGAGVDDLVRTLVRYLPEGPPRFEPDEITDASERTLAAELIREKIFRLLGDELPYSTAVRIENFVQEGRLRRIQATIVVDKESHKGIVIGAGGARLKQVAAKSRLDMERLFGGKVFLEVWVKVKSGWVDDAQALRQLGYG